MMHGFECLAVTLAATALLAADFEAPPAPYQTSPRPADGEVLRVNPPCFVYPATGEHEGFVIEIAPGGEFGQRTIRIENPYQLATLDHALPAGAYAWRWQPQGADVWSEVRQFSIADDAVAVPFPDVDALIQKLGTTHPRIDVTAAELDAVRAKVAARYGTRYAEDVHRNAERSRDKELLPEPAPLPPNTDPKRIELYQKTFQTYRPFLAEMAGLAEAYLLTGDELAGEQAKRRLLAICGWDPAGSSSLSHNDEVGTEVVRHGPVTYDRIHPLLSAAERRFVIDVLTVRMTEMRERWRRRPFELNPYESHNMGYYLPDLTGACLALVGDAPVGEMLRYVLLQLWSPFYPPYGGDDGGWCEGPSYWGWSAAVFARVYQRVAAATGVPVHLRSNLRNQWQYALYGSPTWFKMAPFGDGQEHPAGSGQPMARLAALYDNPYAAWHARMKGYGASGMEGLLTNLDDLSPRPPDDLPQSHAFFDVGLAAMHTVLSDGGSDVAVLLRSSPFGSISHAYADQNTFTLDAYGEPLVIASGYYQLYGHPHHANWTRQTKASNSVLVNNEGQPARDWDAKGKLVTFGTSLGADFAVADATAAYRGKLTRFVRQMVFLKPIHTGGAPILLLRDDLAAPEPATFQFLLHALSQMKLDEAHQRVTIAQGEARCQVDYLAPQPLAFSQHDQFSDPPFKPAPNQWHFIASTTTPAKQVGSVMVLQPHRAGESPMEVVLREADGPTVVLRQGDREVEVRFRPGEVGASSVTRFAGRVVSTALCGGGRVAAEGATWATERPAASRSVYGPDGALLISNDRSAPRLEGGHASDGPGGKLTVEGGPTLPLSIVDLLQVQRRIARATVDVPSGSYRIRANVTNTGRGPLPVTVAAGAAQARQVVVAGRSGTVELVAELGPQRWLTVAGEQALGGRFDLQFLTAARVFGVNLLPHASFEEVADGAPVGWRRATITNNAWADLTSVEDGPAGKRCLQMTCTAAGGDFGAMLDWPGLTPSDHDRRFRISLRVKTNAGDVAGLQVTNADWSFWKNTERLSTNGAWQLAEAEFVLPAGENLTHVRLHCRAAQVGAVLRVDDVALVELTAD